MLTHAARAAARGARALVRATRARRALVRARTGRLAHTRAVRAKCSLAGLTKGGAHFALEKGDHIICQTLPGLPRAQRGPLYPTCCPLVRFSHIASKMLRATGHARMVRPSGRFAEGKTPQRIYFGLKRIRIYFGLNMRQHIVGTVDNLLARAR